MSLHLRSFESTPNTRHPSKCIFERNSRVTDISDNNNANVSGTIANQVRGVDGKYLKALPNDGLEFGNQKLDDNAKLEVEKKDNGNVSLKGLNGKWVKMYYIDDVNCDGNGDGFVLGFVHLADGQVNFTVKGYQGMDGRTKYLSSQARGASYNGSLAVKDIEDFTCRFTIQNL